MRNAAVAPRSCLSVPGSSERMVNKALDSAADEVVIDLEDAVSIDAKDAARALTTKALAHVPTARRVAVRVNAVGTPWCHQDLIALASAQRPPDSVVIPKVGSSGDIHFVERLLHGVANTNGSAPPRVQALIESAAGLVALEAIANSSHILEALILGYADLSADLGRVPAAAPWDAVREHVLWSARANGLRAIDGPYLDIADDRNFQESVTQASRTGFDAKWVIHPQQLETVNAAFTPTSEQLIWAQRVLDTLDKAAKNGQGAVALDGAMLDEAVAVAARRILAKGETR